MGKAKLSHLLIGATIGVLTIIVCNPSSASAGVARSGKNGVERDRAALCDDPAQTNTIFGAVWINDVSTSDGSDDRWKESASITSSATSVDLTMWSTAFNCPDGQTRTGAKIVGLAAAGGGQVPITFPYGTEIYRGDSSPGQFTDPPGSLRIRLDLSGKSSGCYSAAYSGTYSDSRGTGASTTYFTTICINRAVQVQAHIFIVNEAGEITGKVVGAVLETCGHANPTTGSDGFAYFEAGQGEGFCIRVAGGGPGPGYSGPFLRPWSEGYGDSSCGGYGGPPYDGRCDSGYSTYEYQVAGMDATSPPYPSEYAYWDRNWDGGYDIIYERKGPPNTPTVTTQCSGSNSQAVVSWTGGDGSSGYNVDLDRNSSDSDGWWYLPNSTSPTTIPAGGMVKVNGETQDPPTTTLVYGATYRTKIYSNANGATSAWVGFTALDCSSPATDRPPAITITPDCTSKKVKIIVDDPDASAPYNSSYKINSGSYISYSKANGDPKVVDMAGLDQAVAHTVYARSNGVVPAGATPSGMVNAQATYGPCQFSSFTVTPQGDISDLDDENPTSATFKREASSNTKVNNITLTRRYYRKLAGGGEADILAATSESINLSLTFVGPDDPKTFVANPGDQICISLTANPASGTVDGAGNVQTSNGPNTVSKCLLTGAKPYFRVYNADVAVGFNGGCAGWTSSGDRKILGWNDGAGKGAGVQLAALALGRIDQFTSATGRTTDPKPKKGLSFANTSPVEQYGGKFGGSGFCPTDYFASAPTSNTESSPVNISSAPSIKKTSGNTIISGASNFGGRTTLYVEGDVYISGDISYSPSWTISTLPKFSLVARGDIYISKDVTVLDGIYIAQPKSNGTKGQIYTCATAAFNKPTDIQLFDNCNKKLTVNGAFIAKQIKLLRTNGSLSRPGSGNAEAASSNNIAESILFGPEIWLVNPGSPGGGFGSKYDSISALPPVL